LLSKNVGNALGLSPHLGDWLTSGVCSMNQPEITIMGDRLLWSTLLSPCYGGFTLYGAVTGIEIDAGSDR